MNAEDLIIDNSRQTKKVKDIAAIPPNVDRSIFSQTFIIEAVYLSDLT